MTRRHRIPGSLLPAKRGRGSVAPLRTLPAEAPPPDGAVSDYPNKPAAMRDDARGSVYGLQSVRVSHMARASNSDGLGFPRTRGKGR